VCTSSSPVECGERLHLIGSELLCDYSHLPKDVVLVQVLGEGGKLPFDGGGALSALNKCLTVNAGVASWAPSLGTPMVLMKPWPRF
jgi:hypothetical protein